MNHLINNNFKDLNLEKNLLNFYSHFLGEDLLFVLSYIQQLKSFHYFNIINHYNFHY